jgi:hypothetical protein
VLLWWLRRRPYVFGATLCVAFLHREFTIFAATSIAVIHWRGRSWSAAAVARAAASFASVWLLVDLLKRTVNMYGPTGGIHESASLTLQAKQISMWLSIEGRPYLARLSQLVTQGLPDFFGARSHLIRSYGLVGTIAAGSIAAGVAFGGALTLCGWRLIWLARSTVGSARGGPSSFPLYLALTGLQTVLAYGLNSGIAVEGPTIIRYVLFALLLPVAVFGAFFQRESSRHYRGGAMALICVWAGLTLVDNARLLREYLVSPPQNSYRELTDYLVAHRIRYGRAGYWDSYKVTFLSRERVILASTGKVRISAYQARVDANAPNAIVLRRQPCSGGKAVAEWCIDDPFGR